MITIINRSNIQRQFQGGICTDIGIGRRNRSHPRPKQTPIITNSHKHLTALKEWGPAVDAIRNGHQTILLRKGGVKEPTFTPRASQFLLFPTAFHTDVSLLKPSAQSQQNLSNDPKTSSTILFDCVAHVTGAWTTTDPAVLEALDQLHIFGQGWLDARLRWRQTQALTVMEVRGYRLVGKRVTVPAKDEYWGCFSWVDIDVTTTTTIQEIEQTCGAVPALSDAEFAEKQRICRQGLKTLQDIREIPLQHHQT